MHINYFIIRIAVFLILNIRKLKLFRKHLFSNAIKIMLFISDAQFYVAVKLSRTSGSIDLFKSTGKLLPEYIKLSKLLLWDIMDIVWNVVNMTSHWNKIKLQTSIIVPLRDKLKI